jgi:hypothetical protein
MAMTHISSRLLTMCRRADGSVQGRAPGSSSQYNVCFRGKDPFFFGDIPIALRIIRTTSSSCKKRTGDARNIRRLRNFLIGRKFVFVCPPQIAPRYSTLAKNPGHGLPARHPLGLTYFTPLFEYERRCQNPRVTLLWRPYRMTYLPQ